MCFPFLYLHSKFFSISNFSSTLYNIPFFFCVQLFTHKLIGNSCISIFFFSSKINRTAFFKFIFGKYFLHYNIILHADSKSVICRNPYRFLRFPELFRDLLPGGLYHKELHFSTLRHKYPHNLVLLFP